jgi:hypothetical protein
MFRHQVIFQDNAKLFLIQHLGCCKRKGEATTKCCIKKSPMCPSIMLPQEQIHVCPKTNVACSQSLSQNLRPKLQTKESNPNSPTWLSHPCCQDAQICWAGCEAQLACHLRTRESNPNPPTWLSNPRYHGAPLQ